MIRKIFILFFIVLSIYDLSFPQDGKINIISKNDSVLVFLDTIFLGQTPVINFPVSSGNYILKGICKKIGKWDNEIIESSVHIKPGDTNTFELRFRKNLRLITKPENAKVFINNNFVGYSPLNLFYNITDTILFEKDNYETESFPADLIKKELIQISMKPKIIFQQDENNNFAVRKNGSNKTIYYLIGGGLAFGVFAVITKINADDLETEYKSSHNQDIKSKIRTYDTVSGISLMLFEACFLTLSYLLLSN
jgi:hypothetical protein